MLRATIATVALTLALPFTAHATLQLTTNVSGTVFSCVDNAACDTDPTVGTIHLEDQSINGVSVNGAISTAVPSGLITSNSITLVNTTASMRDIQFAVSATNFVGPANLVNTTGSGTFVNAAGSSITLNYYDDPLNQQGAAGPVGSPNYAPGDLVRSFTATTATNSLSSFSDNFSAGLTNPDGPLYSMTMTYSLTLAAGGELNSRGQAEQKTFVPEPASLALLGSSLLGFGLIRRRRKN